MSTIQTSGQVDERGSLRLDGVLPAEIRGRVRVIIVAPESEELTEADWLRMVMAGGAFDDLADPREDIDTAEDGEPFVVNAD
jgi:hypothetical protein